LQYPFAPSVTWLELSDVNNVLRIAIGAQLNPDFWPAVSQRAREDTEVLSDEFCVGVPKHGIRIRELTDVTLKVYGNGLPALHATKMLHAAIFGVNIVVDRCAGQIRLYEDAAKHGVPSNA
jgi:hypothetical protein